MVLLTAKGWRTRFVGCSKNSSSFDPQMFDDGIKTFYNRTGNWGADDIVDIIFDREETALFLARKLYRHFVYHIPDEQIVSELADVLRTGGYELEPVLKTLFKSAHFMNDNFIGSDIKSPLDLILGFIRQFRATNVNKQMMEYVLFQLGQIPFNPPNVAGWKQHQEWLNTSTLPLRQIFGTYMLNSEEEWVSIDFQEFINTYPAPDDPEKLVHDILGDILPLSVSSDVEDELVEILQGSGKWSPNGPEMEARIKTLISAITQMPEYQLK